MGAYSTRKAELLSAGFAEIFLSTPDGIVCLVVDPAGHSFSIYRWIPFEWLVPKLRFLESGELEIVRRGPVK